MLRISLRAAAMRCFAAGFVALVTDSKAGVHLNLLACEEWAPAQLPAAHPASIGRGVLQAECEPLDLRGRK